MRKVRTKREATAILMTLFKTRKIDEVAKGEVVTIEVPGLGKTLKVKMDEEKRLCSEEVQDKTTAKVDEIPLCNFCKEIGEEKPAEYDGKTVYGPWAYMCEDCFKAVGIGLGTGKGQRLIKAESEG